MENALNTRNDAVPSLLFRVQSRLCALPARHVVEIMRPLPTEAIAGPIAAVRGLAVIRGAPTPVLELAELLDGRSGPTTRFVIVTTGARQVALAVGSVIGLRDLPADMLRHVPRLLGDADEHAVSAIGTLDAELLLVLDAARLVPDDAWPVVNAVGMP